MESSEIAATDGDGLADAARKFAFSSATGIRCESIHMVFDSSDSHASLCIIV
ncbi:hypothetical protein OROGR_009447 [Orobanche gracilis]